MKVLYVSLARTIWLFDFRSINPTGMSFRGILEEVAKRYQFAQAPKNELDLDNQSNLSFKSGTFVGQRKVPILVSLSIYNDGFVADTVSSTDEATEFLNDLAKWLKDTYGLAVPKEHKVVHVSQIDFQSEVSLINVNRRFQPLAANLEALAGNPDKQYEVGSIQFWTEDIGKPGSTAAVKIERKISAPFSANHYFSQAPLPTNSHIEFLNEFEAILKQR